MQVPARKFLGVIENLARFGRGKKGKRLQRVRTPKARGSELLTLFPRDATLLDLVEQGLVADAELLGRPAAIPVHLPQRVLDDAALGLERRGLRHVGEPRARWRR